MTIINYVLTLFLISSAVAYEYHMFYVYSGMNFFLVFLPISTTISIDSIRKKLSYLKQGFIYVAPKVSKLNYLVPVFVGLGLVYFDSVIFYKMQSPMWLRGLGLWLPSSLPQITISENQWFLNQEFLVRSLSYLTLYFEFVFIFMFWNKLFRIPLLIIGVGLHLGILIEYPIPYFGLGCSAVYILMVPVSLWSKLWDKIFKNKKNLTIYYNHLDLSHQKFRVMIEALDIFKKVEFKIATTQDSNNISDKKEIASEIYGIDKNENKYTEKLLLNKIVQVSPICYLLVVFDKLSIHELSMLSDSKVSSEFKNSFSYIEKGGANDELHYKMRNVILTSFFFFSCIAQTQVHYSFFEARETTRNVNHFLVKHFGICQHPVFMDAHFRGYNTIYTLKYKGEFLPIVDERGMPDTYLSGGTWVNWMWRVNRPTQNRYSLRKGFEDYTSFWMHNNGLNIYEGQEFEIVRKKINVVFEWQKDLLKNNINSPWEKAGTLKWSGRKTEISWDSSN
ncbi:hypothetical protein [Aquimarina litoralis]|uniref:hypothetical protein n=1 Tax=Aquimarina litoralis TaxID=584605 RepID=UPI001C578611|nr:hypothetical protein [Aquimarina litoralis]MBW1297146.1 hypothetical protein [Aquimarina litoralis]